MSPAISMSTPKHSKVESAEVIFDGEASFVGVGQNTTLPMVEAEMAGGVFDTKYVFVVKDCFDWSEDRPYLSSVIREQGAGIFAVNEKVAGKSSPVRRMVDTYEQNDKTGKYVLVAHDVELFEFLTEWLGVKCVTLAEKDFASPKAMAGERAGPNRAQVQLKLVRPLRAHALSQAGPNDRPSHTTDTVLLVPPTSFFFNTETAQDNEFMHTPDRAQTRSSVRSAALKECNALHAALSEAGIDAHLALNHRADAPDALFPNNWFSTHADGTLSLYSMKAESRRRERIPQTIARLQQLGYTQVENFTEGENEGKVLEGTGAMVLDRANRVCYVCESQRADISVAERWCEAMGYKLFNMGPALDVHGHPIYHTNVVMSVGTSVAVVCMSTLTASKQAELRAQLESTGHALLDISHEQMGQFCGNVLELASPTKGRVMVMSLAAFKAFTPQQHETLAQHKVTPIYADVTTIETLGGGGVRCCCAELF